MYLLYHHGIHITANKIGIKPNPQSNIDFSSFNETEVLNLKKLLQEEELMKQ